MADLQLKIQNLVRLADVANNQLVDIKIVLLQTEGTYKMKISRDVYNISKELKNITHRDME